MKVLEALTVVAISLFIVLGLFLVSNRNARGKGFVFIGFFFLLLALNFLDGILLLRGSYATIPQFTFWEDPFALTYGPLIYFFSLRIKNHSILQSLKFLLHLIPFVLMEISVLAFHIFYSNEDIRNFVTQLVASDLDPKVILGVIPIFIHVFIYILMAWYTLRKHQDELKQQFSLLTISWTFAMVRMILMIFLLSLLSTGAQYFGTSESYAIVLMVLILISIFLTLKILLTALNQPLFPSINRYESTIELSDEERSSLLNQLNYLLKEKKVYRNPTLSLKDLAVEMGTSARAVSHIINKSLADNFYDLINIYRIKEAQRILKDNRDPKQTVLEVLFEVGFNSKSSFNTQFKKKTGMTPSEFKKLNSPKE